MLDGNNVIMQRLVSENDLVDRETFIKLRPETYDKAQKIAAEIGVSSFELEREWNCWAVEKGEEIKSPDGAFVGFCKKRLEAKTDGSSSWREQLDFSLSCVN